MSNKALAVITVLAAMVSLAQEMPANPKQCGVPTTKAAIDRVMQEWKDGYNGGDPAKVAALYAEDATYMTQHYITGIVHGRTAIQAYVKKGTDAKYKLDSLELLSSDCSGDFAYGLTRYRSTNGEQKAMGVNVVVLKKIGGKWMIVAHESAVPDEAVAIKKLEIE